MREDFTAIISRRRSKEKDNIDIQKVWEIEITRRRIDLLDAELLAVSCFMNKSKSKVHLAVPIGKLTIRRHRVFINFFF